MLFPIVTSSGTERFLIPKGQQGIARGWEEVLMKFQSLKKSVSLAWLHVSWRTGGNL